MSGSWSSFSDFSESKGMFILCWAVVDSVCTLSHYQALVSTLVASLLMNSIMVEQLHGLLMKVTANQHQIG